MNIAIAYPAWFIILCVLGGGLYAAVLYYRDKKSEIPDKLKVFLAILRFLTVSAIAFLLLSPFVKSLFDVSEKPVIILAQDNSGSIVTGRDSVFYSDQYPEALQNLKDELQENYKLNIYTFGEKVVRLQSNSELSGAIDFDEMQTNISSLFQEVRNLYSNRNVGAMILASDGIYNTGANPVYYSRDLGFPVYTLALGDTSIKKDVVLAKVNFNRLAYLNNDFPVEVIINADKYKGEETLLKIYKKGKLIKTQDLEIATDPFTTTVNLRFKADETGIHRYRFVIEPLEGEISAVNNVKDIFIEVLDSRNKVLILYNTPHPDITALKEAIRTNRNYEVEDHPAKSFNLPVEKYNLVILHQLPSLENPVDHIFGEIREKQIPFLLIIGQQSNLVELNSMKLGLNILSQSRTFQEVLPAPERNFALFRIKEENIRVLNNFPPLFAPFGDYQVSGVINILMNQRIGTMTTSKPLIFFNETLNDRWGVVTGEGLWRWRLMNFAQMQNHNAFDELILKTVQYLSVREKKTQFRIYHKDHLLENQRLVFDAEVYNKSYELVTEPEVEMTITDSDGNQFPFVFSKYLDAYHLDAGSFQVGEYRTMAKVKVGNDIFTVRGQFIISPLDIETINTIADHNLLYLISEGTNGKTYRVEEMDELIDAINSREDIKTVFYTQKRFEELINIPLVLILIIGLLSLEWMLRKRAGSY